MSLVYIEILVSLYVGYSAATPHFRQIDICDAHRLTHVVTALHHGAKTTGHLQCAHSADGLILE